MSTNDNQLTTTTEEEVWKDIKGYGGFYQISSFGRVKSLPRTHKCCGYIRGVRGRFLKLSEISAGKYLCANLVRDGRNNQRYVHHLVLETFVGPRPEGMQALHYDDNPQNNHIPNLRWGTRKENSDDARRNGRSPRRKHYDIGENHPGSVLTEKQAYRILELWNEGFSNKSELGRMFGVSQTSVHHLIIGKSWKHLCR